MKEEVRKLANETNAKIRLCIKALRYCNSYDDAKQLILSLRAFIKSKSFLIINFI
jgi:hypothetical protein